MECCTGGGDVIDKYYMASSHDVWIRCGECLVHIGAPILTTEFGLWLCIACTHESGGVGGESAMRKYLCNLIVSSVTHAFF